MSRNDNKIVMIPIEKIFPHRDNPRKDLGDLSELSESIKAQGVLQNLTVVPWAAAYPDEPEPVEGAVVTVIGHRRSAAAKEAGLRELPCVIADMDHKTQVSVMLLENLQRADLTVIEQAQGFQMMIDLGSNVHEISEKTGFAERTVQKRLQIAKLDPEKMKKAEARGNVTLNDYIRIASLEDEKERDQVLEWAGSSSFSYYLNQAEEKQKIKENTIIIKEDLKKLGIEKQKGISGNPSYSSEVDVEYSISLTRYGEASKKMLEQKAEGNKWIIWQDFLYLVKPALKKKRTAPAKSKKEIKNDERRAALKEKYLFMRELRRKFVIEFNAHKKYKDVIYKWLLYFIVFNETHYSYQKDQKLIEDVTGEKNTGGDRIKADKLLEFAEKDERAALTFAYYLASDTDADYYYLKTCDMYWGENRPEYKQNKRLEKLYEMLEELGYPVSDEERSMLDGTHELFGK